MDFLHLLIVRMISVTSTVARQAIFGKHESCEHTFEEPADDLEFACRVPGHNGAGMSSPITVE